MVIITTYCLNARKKEYIIVCGCVHFQLSSDGFTIINAKKIEFELSTYA